MKSSLWPAVTVLALLPGLGFAADLGSPPDGQTIAPPAAPSDDTSVPANWAVHGQSTFLFQYHPGFGSSIPPGPQTLDNGRRGAETSDVTIYGGIRLWKGAEFWINPEADQGFGLQNTLGIAGFTSGEAYKVGEADPYYRMARAFFRQTIGLGGETEKVDPDLNVLGGTQDKNRLVITVGKFSVTDIFDTNWYAHDPRADFMNWSLIDSGAFDWAADSWGFTYGAAVEWTTGLVDATRGTVRFVGHPELRASGPAARRAVRGRRGGRGAAHHLWPARQTETAGLVEPRLDGAAVRLHPGGRGDRSGPLAGVITALNNRPGVALNLEQSITADLGMFARLSTADGRYETFDFTDIDQSAAVGLSLKGKPWRREDDVVGAAFVVNEASRQRLDFFRAGGLGVLVGDGFGQPARAGPEQILETYYNVTATKWLNVTVDYQLVNHPAYNVGRGPVHVFGFRLHAQI